jgi:integrase
MARPSKGWRLRKRAGRPYSVRFTIGGIESEPGLGTYDRDEAERLAADLYADAVRGARRVARRAPARGQPLTEVASQWLTDVSSTIDPETRATYAGYVETHFARMWPTVEAVTDASAALYARNRLRAVQASTVRKELSALRGLLGWCAETGRIPQAPLVPSIPKRAVGTKHKQGRRGPAVWISPKQARAILARLVQRNRLGFPVRAYFTTLYETSLRPSTVKALSVPENWAPGRMVLDIPLELDKARDGRPVPLTPAAVQALSFAAPAAGVVFGPVDLRVALRKAALPVLGEALTHRLTPYDFRRNRITHWTERSTNLPGVMHLAGHTSLATTAKYVKGSERAARAVLGSKRRK